jgi:AcrR family transcriptional regulator
MKKKPTKSSAQTPLARQDGIETKRQLLEAAGEVFAEHGYAKATSKEICARAGANIAAVNYHFGGKDELYGAVLQEAHARLISLDSMQAAAQSRIDPRTKLRMFLSRIVAEVTRGDTAGWELRVLSREVLSRSPMMGMLIQNQIAPKAKLLRGMLAEIMELSPDHPAVSRCLINIMGPFLMLLITDRALQKQIAPKLDLDAQGLADHMVTYALAGIEAVAKRNR